MTDLCPTCEGRGVHAPNCPAAPHDPEIGTWWASLLALAGGLLMAAVTAIVVGFLAHVAWLLLQLGWSAI